MTPAAERVLDVASKLFYDNGIHAVGVEAIASEAGVTKKTLYDRFGSKDALVAHYLSRRDERWRRLVLDTVERRGARTAARRRPLLVFDALEEWMAAQNTRGCAFVNAQAELPDVGHPGRAVIRAQKDWMLDYLRTLVREAGVGSPRKLATSLLVLVEGATVTASLGVATGAVANAKEAARRLIETA